MRANSKGVYFDKRDSRFYAYVYRDGDLDHIGPFMTEQAALAALKQFLAAT